MWQFISFLVLVFIISVLSKEANYEQVNEDAIVPFEGCNNEEATKNAATIVKINIKIKSHILDLRPFECLINLKSLNASGIGLESITNESLRLLPKLVQNLTIVNNQVRTIGNLTFANLTVQHLNLSSNKINAVAPDAFNFMTNLEYLNLDNNELSSFNITFLGCQKLKFLTLKHNAIKQLYEGILKQLKHNVFTIVLSYNKIEHIHKSTLDVKQFNEVHLDHNELTNAQLLIKLVRAELVDLSNNRISCLPKEFMENGLSKIKVLNLTANPLECNCLQDLRKKIRRNVEFQKMSPLVQNINIILPKNNTKQCK
ncbi:hypothetical protein ABEB36_003449 [Hypothenemus hampei]|uniref:Uncharacterized protein n=1 Tax=Hypothenemus hampei TaxID=57062 RepID=A0ABD1F975_HYPHA